MKAKNNISAVALKAAGGTVMVTKAGVDVYVETDFDFAERQSVSVYLRLNVKGGGYCNLCVSADGKTVDYGFPRGVANRVSFDTPLVQKEGKTCVLAHLCCDSYDAEEVCISEISIKEAEAQPHLLGGVALYQLAAVSQLMQSYAFITTGGSLCVVDGGDTADAQSLAQFISEHGGRVKHWFLSHYHCDHINAVTEIIENYPIQIENLYYDFPSGEQIQRMSTDKDFYCPDALVQAVKKNGGKIGRVVVPRRGDEFAVDECTVKVLNDAYKGEGDNYGNDSTVVYKLCTMGESVLFLGDLGVRGDEYLKDEFFLSEIVDCTVIQLAHHGQRGVTDEFYSRIRNKKICLFAAKKWLYDNDNGSGFNSATLDTLHTRDLVREWGARTVTQVDGTVLIK